MFDTMPQQALSEAQFQDRIRGLALDAREEQALRKHYKMGHDVAVTNTICVTENILVRIFQKLRGNPRAFIKPCAELP